VSSQDPVLSSGQFKSALICFVSQSRPIDSMNVYFHDYFSSKMAAVTVEVSLCLALKCQVEKAY
jgi:hypothetical protein